MAMQNDIINIVPESDDYEVGFADLGDLIKDRYPYRYAVVVGKRLDDVVVDAISEGPTPDYYALYRSTNDELNLITEKVERFLGQNGFGCARIESTMRPGEANDAFMKTLRAGFSHKMAATRAGLGWIGKTDLLVSKRFGPRVRLATVLTDYPFEKPGLPVRESLCGSCDLCVEVCPAKAASGRLWNDTLDRDVFFDAFKCFETCRRLSLERLNLKASVCGICVSVCPRGKRKG
ncbi:MAG TPA: 4Fe-4S binding protein [Smithellaceae bacterium]|nr:4Fe-4S binding protein [Smithellaceae bacterium]